MSSRVGCRVHMVIIQIRCLAQFLHLLGLDLMPKAKREQLLSPPPARDDLAVKLVCTS